MNDFEIIQRALNWHNEPAAREALARIQQEFNRLKAQARRVQQAVQPARKQGRGGCG